MRTKEGLAGNSIQVPVPGEGDASMSIGVMSVESLDIPKITVDKGSLAQV